MHQDTLIEHFSTQSRRQTKMLTYSGKPDGWDDFRCLSWCHFIYFGPIMFLLTWL